MLFGTRTALCSCSLETESSWPKHPFREWSAFVRLLIANNDMVFLKSIRSCLMSEGHEPYTTRSGVECLELLQDLRPDLVVLSEDLWWGGCDGVLECIQCDPSLAGTPVILIAKNNEDEKQRQGYTSSTITSLGPPFRLSDLLERIASVGQSNRFVPLSAGTK